MPKTKIQDCRAIEGDVGVIISRDTAEAALSAMRKLVELGEYKNLMADDASFIRANMKELEDATNG
jgi:hypothetical protein